MASSLVNMAIANFTRLRPSRIPARKNRVRRCCFTVRGLILSWPAISLLLQPCTSKVQDLLIAGRHFDLVQFDHGVSSCSGRSHSLYQVARLSPIIRIPKLLGR